MGDDWQVGDLALCVAKRTHGKSTFAPGGIYTVSGVVAGRFKGKPEVGLKFDGDHVGADGKEWIRASRFRKIRPHTPDAEDVETIRLLNGAPVLEPTP